MSEMRRSEFVRRISSVGWGVRESVQVLLGKVVGDVREGIVRKRFDDADLDEVVAFHDKAEALWQQSIATNPPVDRDALVQRLRTLLAEAQSPVLGEFHRSLERGLRLAEEFQRERESDE